jgi:hypothetical protein
MRLLASLEPHKATCRTPSRRPAPRILGLAVLAVTALTGSAYAARDTGAGHDESASAEPETRARAIDDATEPAPAAARPLALLENRRVLSYPLAQVWPTAIRYLRIDRGFKVTDRDEQAGYMMFEFPVDGGRIGSGSVEMFATEDASGRPSVSISVNTGAGPVHLPNAILDGIAAKVRAERGQPITPPTQQPPTPPKDDEPEDDNSVPLLPPASDP